MITSIRFIIIAILIHLVSGLPLTVNDKDDVNNYKVHSLPGLSKFKGEVPIMYSGHLEIDLVKDTNYYFWKFVKPNTTQSRTIFWLNGGPGCSSMDGALMEIGPLRVNKDIEVEFNNGSWYELGDLVFVDQPGGTGFSYTNDYDKELSEVADDFIVFLRKYYELFPGDLAKEVYIAGESYAGQYIPYIARLIANHTEVNYNLKGLLIGNGWIAPNEQSLSYIPFLLEAGIISKHDSFLPDLLQKQELCQNAINHGVDKLTRICDSILDHMLSYTKNDTLPLDEQCINMYDYRLRDSYPSCGMNWPPLLPYVNQFLRDDTVMRLLNLKKQREWNECDGQVSKYLKLLKSKQAIVYFPELLENYKIMLFNGDRDIICNSMSTETMISNLEWGGSRGFSADILAENWYFDDLAAGTLKLENNLTFVTVFNASHMVPFDNSAVSRGLMDIMLDNVSPYKDGFETPIYLKLIHSPQNDNSTSSPGRQSKPDYDEAISSHSIVFYIFEIVVVIIILYGIHYFYKYYNEISSRKPASILHSGNGGSKSGGAGNSNRKNKKVHWVDEMNDNGNQTPLEEEINGSNGKHSNNGSQVGLMSNLWNKWSSSYTKIPSTGNGNEDIEMTGGEVNRAEEEFIIESDEE